MNSAFEQWKIEIIYSPSSMWIFVFTEGMRVFNWQSIAYTMIFRSKHHIQMSKRFYFAVKAVRLPNIVFSMGTLVWLPALSVEMTLTCMCVWECSFRFRTLGAHIGIARILKWINALIQWKSSIKILIFKENFRQINQNHFKIIQSQHFSIYFLLKKKNVFISIWSRF